MTSPHIPSNLNSSVPSKTVLFPAHISSSPLQLTSDKNHFRKRQRRWNRDGDPVTVCAPYSETYPALNVFDIGDGATSMRCLPNSAACFCFSSPPYSVAFFWQTPPKNFQKLPKLQQIRGRPAHWQAWVCATRSSLPVDGATLNGLFSAVSTKKFEQYRVSCTTRRDLPVRAFQTKFQDSVFRKQFSLINSKADTTFARRGCQGIRKK